MHVMSYVKKCFTCYHEIDANPPECDHLVLVLDAEHVHHDQNDGDQDVDEG